MKHRKLVAGVATLGLVVGASAPALAAGPPPKRATIKAVSSAQVKVNRYIKDKLRWNKDTYQVRTGGTLHLVNTAPDSGPHTFSVVTKGDLPNTPKEILGTCSVCEQLGQAHGANPESDAPPKFVFLEDGVGSEAPPVVDKAGDSALLPMEKGGTLDLTVGTSKATLHFVCLIHPWMQGKVLVRK